MIIIGQVGFGLFGMTMQLFISSQLITCSVALLDQGVVLFSSFAADRLELWENLHNHQSSPIHRGKPWLIMGDFNEVLAADEHSDFPNISVPLAVCEISRRWYQAVTFGSSLSWSQIYLVESSNHQVNNPISKKLDR